VRVARARFAEQGYAATTVDAVLADAGEAKGALYHHFAGKEQLLRAVVAESQADLTTAVEAAMAAAASPWDGVVAGCEAMLDACSDPATQRILVLDHPAVLGASEGSPLGGVVDLLRDAIARAAASDGNPCRLPLAPLAQMLCGALAEGALAVAHAPDPSLARVEVGDTTRLLLRAIRSELLAC
jgi:AcrR family transcriptional regulator